MSDQSFLREPDLTRVYEEEKSSWLADHPGATYQEYEQAIREIVQRIGY